MIVSRTPLRISFLGGGTDYPSWYRKHGGAVLSTTIDKYCYLTVRHLPPFFEHKNRVVYRIIETTRTVGEIQHPTARAVLEHLNLDGVEIHHGADLPARSGMGTSSAFTVGLLHACYALKNRRLSKGDLAREALYIEQDVLKETVGSQDQVAAAFGGLNLITFSPSRSAGVGDASLPGAGDVSRSSARDTSLAVAPLGPAVSPAAATAPEWVVDPVMLPAWRMAELQQHLLLFFTGLSRTASEVADSFVPGLAKSPHLPGLVDQVDEGLRLLEGAGSIVPFGEILHHAWTVKRQLSGKVSTPEIDLYYQDARAAGALGGKLLGAGGGGFLLLFARPEDHAGVIRRMAAHSLLHVPFRFGTEGSRIVVYDP